MVRDQYSYWLDVKGENIIKAARLIKQDGTLSLAMASRTKNYVQFQVDERFGTIEEWTDMEDTLIETSKECPDTTFSMLAINENTGDERRLVYKNGICVKNIYSRMVGADDKCDKQTAKDIVALLEKHGHTEAARLVQAAFID